MLNLIFSIYISFDKLWIKLPSPICSNLLSMYECNSKGFIPGKKKQNTIAIKAITW